MTAALIARRPTSSGHMRPFNPGRDLSALADLIEVGFSKSLDRSGRRMVQGMRSLGRLGWLGGVLSRWVLPPAANPRGFVWEEDGRVLGNASLLPVLGYPHRWVMANVAVLPDQRRRGIGRSLVTASISDAQHRGAHEIILQVDQENEGARLLYQSMGFTSSPPRTTWIGRVDQAHEPRVASQVRRRVGSEWRDQWELARDLHPEGLVWPYPISAGYFRPRAWQQRLGLDLDRHWVWFEDERLLGSVSLRWGFEPGQLRMILLVEPESRGQIEPSLITASLRNIQPMGDFIVMDYPMGAAEQIFRGMGFKVQRNLLWMRLAL